MADHVASLAEGFRGVHRDVPPACASGVLLEQLLGEVHAAGQAGWPGIRVPGPVFASWLAGRWSGQGDVEAWLRQRDAAGLYLACACVLDVPGAQAALERHYLTQVPVYLGRLTRAGARELFVDEVRQLLREKLLLGDGRPRLAEYAGQGALGSFVRISALRIGLDLLRRREGAIPEQGGDEPILGPEADPELAYVKERYRPPLRAALRAAMAVLSSEDRNLLRLHFVERLSIDRLGEVFHIHRATAARRLQQARARVVAAVQREVRVRLQVDDQEAQELLTLVRSQLDLSLRTLLGGS